MEPTILVQVFGLFFHGDRPGVGLFQGSTSNCLFYILEVSTTSTGLHCEPPITYDSSFDRTKNKLATLKVYDANSNSQEWKIPIFSEEGGLEELFYCEEAFLIGAKQLPLPENRYIELFTKILCPEEQRKWDKTTRDDNDNLNYPDNIEGYEEAFKDYIQEHYCDADDAQETMQAYICSDACKKPHDTTAKDHALCINWLICQLSKTTMLLHTFPNLWIEQCGQIHGGITKETSIQKIVEYMSSQERQSKLRNGGKKQGRRPGTNANDSNAKCKNNTKCNNAKHIKHVFKVDDKVWMKEPDPDKLQPQKKGPYQIVQVHTNGTVKLRLSPNVTETVNIRKLTPYKEHPANNDPAQGEPANNDLDMEEVFQTTEKQRADNNKNNDLAGTTTTDSNESFQAHMQRAKEGFLQQHGGKAEHSVLSAVTLPPGPQDLDANLALPIGLTGGPLSTKGETEPTGRISDADKSSRQVQFTDERIHKNKTKTKNKGTEANKTAKSNDNSIGTGTKDQIAAKTATGTKSMTTSWTSHLAVVTLKIDRKVSDN
eukprot:jgi/Psemu1/43084/gm1.43084_g